ncbi:RNA polymerase sigma factor [Rubripirellula tenax]|nr:sigma-70 family RNA polymerase sigma factor [Rubripirellula tenax]
MGHRRRSGTEVDEDAFREVFEESTPGLRRFLAGRLKQTSDIDDCLQAVCVAMIQSGSRVVPAARRAWLFRVAANEASQVWRRQGSTEKMMSTYGQADFVDDDPAIQAIRDETRQLVCDAIGRLPAEERDVVSLRMQDNLTFQQISKRLGIPLGTALTRMRRALERLRHEIQPDDR